MIWYVNSSQGRLGRYNPQTGEIAEWPSPNGPDSHPYGLAYADGAIWYNESGMRPDALVRFDPATETFQSWAIPSGNVYGGIVRHMRTTRDGNLLIHQASTNRIIPGDAAANACDQLGPTVHRLARFLCGGARRSRQPLLAHTPSVAASPFMKSITKSGRRFVSR